MDASGEISANLSLRPRTHGLRLSLTDVVVLIAGGLIGIVGFPFTEGLSLFVPFVVLHFFLFCNVFRIRRVPELIWAAVFLLNCTAWIATGNLNLAAICGAQLPVTLLLIGYELRQPTYHGICAQRINPRLDEYLSGKI